MKRRNLVLAGAVGTAAAVAGIRCSLVAAAPRGAPLPPGFWQTRFEKPEGGELVLANYRGKPLVLEFLGHTVPALHHRTAAARALPARTAKARLDGARAGRRQPDAGARVPAQAAAGPARRAGRVGRYRIPAARWAILKADCPSRWCWPATARCARASWGALRSPNCRPGSPRSREFRRVSQAPKAPIVNCSQIAPKRVKSRPSRSQCDPGVQPEPSPRARCAASRTMPELQEIESVAHRRAPDIGSKRDHQRPETSHNRWRAHGPSQAQDTDRSGVGIEHLGTGNHRSRRQGPHRQVGSRCRRDAVPGVVHAGGAAGRGAGRGRRGSPPAAPAATAPAPAAETGHVVKSPMVGTFYRSSSRAASPSSKWAARSRKASRSASSRR